MNNVNKLYNKHLDTYKKNYNSGKVKEEEKRGRDYKQFPIIDNGNQEPKLTKKGETETKNPDAIQKPLCVKLNKNDFDSLTQDAYNNLNNYEFKTTVDKKAYDLKNAKTFLVKITTQKTSEKKKNYCVRKINKGKDRRNNILNVLKNLESVCSGVYLNYSDKPSESKESISERTKLRRKRSDGIAEKEKMIDPESFREYFKYSSPSDMYNNLNKTIVSEDNNGSRKCDKR